jgi:CO dehydrogenase/acetyl-CoA synthase delta subunit
MKDSPKQAPGCCPTEAVKPESTGCCAPQTGSPAGSPCSCCGGGVPAEASPCCDTVETVPEPPLIREIRSEITFSDRFDHFRARWGLNRMGHTVEPGLYRLGNPTPQSEVFVSANYTLSFDALRSALAGRDAYILVLDTKGINVWCAAGKGTFGTDELVRRIGLTGLAKVVSHRRLILPQLSAPGVSWPEVLRRSGFLVEYGPARARDLPEYLKTRKATPAMRRVEFPLVDRIVLIPVELVHALPFMLVPAIALWFLGSRFLALEVVLAFLAGIVLFPLLLPWLPTKDFSTKGLVLGFVVMLLPAIAGSAAFAPYQVIAIAATLLVFPPITAYIALNFTGATPFTSRTGVKKEIFRYVPVMAAMAGTGAAIAVLTAILCLLGVI